MAWLFKKTLLKGETPMLIMELPPYKRPSCELYAAHVGSLAVVSSSCGTVILGINILLWFLATYPHDRVTERQFEQRKKTVAASNTNQLAALDKESKAPACAIVLPVAWANSLNQR